MFQKQVNNTNYEVKNMLKIEHKIVHLHTESIDYAILGSTFHVTSSFLFSLC